MGVGTAWEGGRASGGSDILLQFTYLGRVLEIERVVEFKVHEAHESRVELDEGQHYSEVNVSRHLRIHSSNKTINQL